MERLKTPTFLCILYPFNEYVNSSNPSAIFKLLVVWLYRHQLLKGKLMKEWKFLILKSHKVTNYLFPLLLQRLKWLLIK